MVGSSPPAVDGFVQFLTSLADLSPAAMLVLAIIAFTRGWVVLPREVESRDKRVAELEKERDEYKVMVFRALDVGERITSVAEERRR